VRSIAQHGFLLECLQAFGRRIDEFGGLRGLRFAAIDDTRHAGLGAHRTEQYRDLWGGLTDPPTGTRDQRGLRPIGVRIAGGWTTLPLEWKPVPVHGIETLRIDCRFGVQRLIVQTYSTSTVAHERNSWHLGNASYERTSHGSS